MTDIDDLLDQRMSGSTGDYPPWFDEEGTEQGEPPLQSEGNRLEGRITNIRDDPFYDPEDEDEPKPILHVQTDEGNVWSTRTHSVLVDLIRTEEPEEGDYIRIQYDGNFKTDTGQVANDYQIAVVREEELEQAAQTKASADGGTTTEASDESSMADSAEIEVEEPTIDDSVEEMEDDDDGVVTPFDPGEHTVADIKGLVQTIDDSEALESLLEAEQYGSDRKTAKYHINDRLDDVSGSETPSDDDEQTQEVDGDVIEFTESLLSFHDELTMSELDEYINETRDFDVDVEAVVPHLDAEVDGDIVRNA